MFILHVNNNLGKLSSRIIKPYKKFAIREKITLMHNKDLLNKY